MATDREHDAVRQEVRDRYASAALAVLEGDADAGCCGGSSSASSCQVTATPSDAAAGAGAAGAFGAALYADAEQAQLPDAAVLASLGCGNPTAVAELGEGETVLDLGSGGGIDVLLSARRVGPSGRAIGLDMTDEMLELARRNAAEAGVDNVEFVAGTMEHIPLPDASVDVVISNCVINLSTDKPAVFSEIARVLRPGGRVGVSDIVAEDRLTPADRAARGSHVGCIAGALSSAEYHERLTAAGLVDAEVVFTHEVADGLHGAIVRARRPD